MLQVRNSNIPFLSHKYLIGKKKNFQNLTLKIFIQTTIKSETGTAHNKPSMNEIIHYILERLPEKSHLIHLRMEKDPDFATLCEDYNDCVNALRYWSRSKTPEAETRVGEYRIIIREIEEEICQELAATGYGQMD